MYMRFDYIYSCVTERAGSGWLAGTHMYHVPCKVGMLSSDGDEPGRVIIFVVPVEHQAQCYIQQEIQSLSTLVY